MATNTSGGTTTSFSNTPQAAYDNYTADEGQIYAFDVMGNDLGGKAKILWSIDDGNRDGATLLGGTGDGTVDLLTADNNATAVPEFSDLGARIWIHDGKVKYDASALDWLAAGQTATDNFTYAIRLSNGTLSWATVAVTVTGSNDAPVVSVGAGDDSAELTETNSGLTASGALTLTDLDTSDVVDVTVSSVAVSGTGGAGGLSNDDLKAMLSLTGNTDNAADGTAGSLGWSFASGSQAFNHLADGETLVLTYTLTASDGNGGSDTHDVTVTVTGSNDAPVVANAVADEDVDEDTAWSFTVPADSFSDVDGDALSYSATLGNDAALPSWLSFDAATRTFSGTPPQDFNGTIALKVTASDGALSASDSFDLVVNPVNDAPVVANAVVDEDVDEDTAWSFMVPADSFSDVDGDALSYSATLGDDAALPSWLSFDAATRTFSGTPPQDFNGTIALKVTVSDDALSVSDTFDLVINPINDAPVVANAVADEEVDEDTAWSFTVPADGFSDVDGDALSYSATLGNDAALPSWLSFDAATRTFSGTPPQDFNGTIALKVTASDGALSASDTFDLVINPVNDAPVVANAVANEEVDEDTAWSFTVPADGFSDVDGDALSYSATLGNDAALPSWLSFDAATRTFSGTPQQDFNGTIALKVTASDGALSASDTFDLVVNPVDDFVYVSPAVVTSADDNDFDLLHQEFTRPSVLSMSTSGTADLYDGSNLADVIRAGNGGDTVYGHGGADIIFGENGADISIYGQAGDDTIHGGSAGDTIYGGSGNDTIYGNQLPESGGDAGDFIFGGSGNDLIHGQGGDDTIVGGHGQDIVYGNAGNDVFIYRSASDTGDFIMDFVKGSDRVDLAAFNFESTDFAGAIGSEGAVGAGQFGYMTSMGPTGSITTLYVDTNGAYGADLEIKLVSSIALSTADFVL